MSLEQILKPGTRLRAQTLGECHVDRLLGKGGQGEVYLAKLGGKPMAVKWYNRLAATAQQKQILEHLTRRAAPNGNFLWPMDLTFLPNLSTFGYVMPLREERYKDMRHILGGKFKVTYRARATAARELAEGFLKLHVNGLCYRDINAGNVFLEPPTGHILICDNDNVDVNNSRGGGIVGTPGFMAPEVYRREKPPNTFSDQHSLAVLFFLLFVGADPMLGAREAKFDFFDEAAMLALYGTHPVFIYDPDDPSNRPIPGDDYHKNAVQYWPILPKFVQKLFTQTFTQGLKNPSQRVVEAQWRDAMVRLGDQIVYCGKCKTENFWDACHSKAEARVPLVCRSCKQPVQVPFRLDFGGREGQNCVMLNWNTKLYPHHLDGSYGFAKPVAEVVIKDGQWGLMNLAKEQWTVTEPDGVTRKTTIPGRPMRLVPGRQVQFGRKQATIQY